MYYQSSTGSISTVDSLYDNSFSQMQRKVRIVIDKNFHSRYSICILKYSVPCVSRSDCIRVEEAQRLYICITSVAR